MRLLLASADALLPLAGTEGDAPLIGVIAGDDIALHRVQLLETAPKRRFAEAMMLATDLSAQPLDDVHVALGEADEAGNAWLGLIARDQMAAHLAHFAAHGAEPDSLVPAALLLPAPTEQATTFATLENLVLLRTQSMATATDACLVELLADKQVPQTLAPFAAVFSVANPLPLDLRQGEFALPLRWWRLRSFRIALAVLLLAVALLAAAPILMHSLRTRAAAAAADTATLALARQSLGTQSADAASAGAALSAARRAAEAGAISPRLSFLAASVEQVPGVHLEAVRLTPGGRLLVTLGGPADAINRVGSRLVAGPFNAALAGRILTLGDRREARASSQAALPVAIARTITAQADATLLRAKGVEPRDLPSAALVAAFAAAGLEATPTVGAPIRVEAARATILLPLLAELEAQGARFSSLSLTRNEDQTLAAEIGFSR